MGENIKSYFVEWLSHNGETDGWAYKNVTKFDNLDDAKKEYHKTLSTYIGYGKLDHVSVVLHDENYNIIMRESWNGTVVVEPTEPTE